jgi:hypothetical protein
MGDMSDATISIPKDEYEALKAKADIFDQFIESEELTDDEIDRINKAIKGPFLSKSEFQRRHRHLS